MNQTENMDRTNEFPAVRETGEEKEAHRKKLTEAAMLALGPEAARELARDFDSLRVRLDAVVRSEAAAGTPCEGPIHTEDHKVLPPEAALAETGSGKGEGRGRALLSQAARFDGVYAVVPRVV